MHLEELKVELMKYGKNIGQYEGRIKFANNGGEVILTLSPAMCAKVLSLCAEGVVESAQQIGAMMVADVIDGEAKLLEST